MIAGLGMKRKRAGEFGFRDDDREIDPSFDQPRGGRMHD
jgi:hypothetical protein